MSEERPPAPAPEPPPTAKPAPSRRAIDLVAAYGVAQWNVVQAGFMQLGGEQFAEAKARQVAAYEALMRYIAELEGRR